MGSDEAYYIVKGKVHRTLTNFLATALVQMHYQRSCSVLHQLIDAFLPVNYYGFFRLQHVGSDSIFEVFIKMPKLSGHCPQFTPSNAKNFRHAGRFVPTGIF